jgi:branched-chain amino acid transport system ATP-binding protein
MAKSGGIITRGVISPGRLPCLTKDARIPITPPPQSPLWIAPVLVERSFETIREINEQGTTILLVEQNANVALEIATRGCVLETGKIVNSAPAEKLREGPKVREAYLGEI